MRHNAAIYLLSSRTFLLKKCLINLHKNWNFKYDYPVYVHHFNNIYSKKFIDEIHNSISKNIFFHQVDYKIPSHIKESELFYNKTHIEYVRKGFSKNRLGYLHMLKWAFNLTSFGKIGCPIKELSKYDYLMRIDDDSYFKEKIEFDLFDKLDEHPLVTGYTWNFVSQRVLDTRVELWSFYKEYLKKYNYSPKNLALKKAIEEDDEMQMHYLNWTSGNCNLYNMAILKNNPKWEEYLKYVNNFGGHYKYRWGDIEIVGLFYYTHFEKDPYNYDLKERGLYDNKIPSYASNIAPGINDRLIKNNILYDKIIHFLKQVNFERQQLIFLVKIIYKKLGFLFNKSLNLIYQKIKYKKNYTYKIPDIVVKHHENNIYHNEVKNRKSTIISKYETINFKNICFDNTISLNNIENPLVLTSNEVIKNPDISLENTSIYKYNHNFRPKNFTDVYFTKSQNMQQPDWVSPKLSVFTIFYPWFHPYPQRFLQPGMFGLKDISFPKVRLIRIKNLINLFNEYGYIPNNNDIISGYKLISNNDYRFIITAGTHRSSVFKVLYGNKENSIKVKFDDLRVKKDKQIIELKNINIWPGVKSGFMSKEEAKIFFLNFFLN